MLNSGDITNLAVQNPSSPGLQPNSSVPDKLYQNVRFHQTLSLCLSSSSSGSYEVAVGANSPLQSSLFSSGFWDDGESLGESRYSINSPERGKYYIFEGNNAENSKTSTPVNGAQLRQKNRTPSAEQPRQDATTIHETSFYSQRSSFDSDQPTAPESWVKKLLFPEGPNRPITRLEAALRRAEEAEELRQKALKNGCGVPNESHGTDCAPMLPYWGSPLVKRSIYEKLPSPHITTGSNFEEKNNEPAEEIVATSSHDVSVSLTEDDSVSFGQGSPVLPSGDVDLCTEMERWLDGRPHRLYHTSRSHLESLQLCYLSDHECDVTSIESDDDCRTCTPKRFSTIHVDTRPEKTPSPSCSPQHPASPRSRRQSVSNVSIPLPVFLPSDPKDFVTLRQSFKLSERSRLQEHLQQISHNFMKILELESIRSQSLLPAAAFPSRHRPTDYATEWLERHRKLEADVDMALSQVPVMAQMQIAVERVKVISNNSTVESLLKRFVEPSPNGTRLEELNLSQLQLLVNYYHTRIEALNNPLKVALIERDELYLERGSKLMELEDLTKQLEQLLQSQIQQQTGHNTSNLQPRILPAQSTQGISAKPKSTPFSTMIALFRSQKTTH